MKINQIKINSFGKIKQKEIKFKDNINVIYGKNESGKSTLIKFILNTFYGISKNKKGKEFSDYDRFLPWDTEEFSGNLDYELDNGEKIKIYRDFKKKNPEIYNEKMVEISKKFNIDKTKGNEFFYEQTKVDEDLFLSTLLIGQQEVKLESKEQNMLVQKIANIMGTGEDNVFFKKAIDRINKRQLDEIGTERSREKPINIVESKISELEGKINELLKYQEYKYEIEEKKNYQQNMVNELQEENRLLKEIKLLYENQKIEYEKIKIKEELQKANDRKIDDIEENIKRINENTKEDIEKNLFKNQRNFAEKIKKDKKKNKIYFSILILLNVIQFVFIHNVWINIGISLSIPIFGLYAKNKMNKKRKINEKEEGQGKKEIEKIDIEIEQLKKQLEELKNEKRKLEKEINELEKLLVIEKEKGKEEIAHKYVGILESEKINHFLKFNDTKELNEELQNLETALGEEKIILHKLDIDRKNIEPKLDSIAKMKEELDKNKRIKEGLVNKLESINLAKEVLNNAYELMKDNVTPKFTKELSKNVVEITNGKYAKVMLNDKKGLLVETENGKYVEASRLSVGTIDQLYLSLRLAMIEEISEENMPIILDESFAYYDNERLKNVLKFIDGEFKKHQVIILTCTNREKEILKELSIDVNEIDL